MSTQFAMHRAQRFHWLTLMLAAIACGIALLAGVELVSAWFPQFRQVFSGLWRPVDPLSVAISGALALAVAGASLWPRAARAIGQAGSLPGAPLAPAPSAIQRFRDSGPARVAPDDEHRAPAARAEGTAEAWTDRRLRDVLHSAFDGNDIIVVSNREPYIHVRTPDGIRIQRPASGLVTALEPVMRACSGVWIAHGSGSADRDTVDRHDRVAVPPENPLYTMRRVWLTPEEEQGYYFGFANEGLWPLCHIAHVRPTFRTADWQEYRRVNARFSDAVAREAHRDDPIVLVQDYHFALLPRMIRDRLPRATVIAFWHIPWPNPEAFAICPWRRELLDGLLGSSILGFHTQFHCNNFVDTVDRQIEALVDRETFTVTYHGMETRVRRYPISIEWPAEPHTRTGVLREARAALREARAAVLARHGLPAKQAIGVGIDRLDYTKGIEERLHAIARLLEMHPRWVGRFTFIQIGAPSRTSIAAYRSYSERVRGLADDINRRFSGARAPPIVLLAEHHEPTAVGQYLRAADLCFVSSLHDGMNLVAKEFVRARDDEAGVLVLSQFTGASRELTEALIVNPYDADECATALHRALTMPSDEQRERMRLLRARVREFNVYRWAGRMLLDAAEMRQRSRFRREDAAERV